MTDIFVSYASEDRERIRPLVSELTNQGWSVWWDRELITGHDFEEKIEQALSRARCVIVAWSESAVHSRWCRDEANEGIERGVLVPLRLDGSRPPLSFRGTHTADLSGWPEQQSEIADVIKGVRRCLEVSTGEVAAPNQLAAATPENPRRISKLKTHATSLVGRSREVADVVELLGEHKIVTLTGVGGVGKTRLAMQVATELQDSFRHGACFVELAPLTDPSAVPDAVAAALGIAPQAGLSVMCAVAKTLREQNLLLVLDNCEHVLDAAADLVEMLLAETEAVTVVATSRESLRLAAEQVWPVPVLDVSGGAKSAAVSLFVERASAANPHFELDTEAESEAVVEICRHLDGIALAIELAAARMVSMKPEDLLERLGDRFRLLSGPRRGLARHQTLRNTVKWSYDLLTVDEQNLLAHCAVFAGGFQVGAACRIAGDALDEYDVLDLLDSLVRKSLVTTDERAGHTRYRMLETIRDFAKQQLIDTGLFDEAQHRYVRYFADEAKSYWEIWDSPEQGLALDWVNLEFANLRAGFRWTANRGDLETATTIAAHTAMLSWASERYEPVEWAEEILEDAVNANLQELPRLYAAASLCTFLGRPEPAAAYAQNAQRLDTDPDHDGFATEFSYLLEANAHLYTGGTERSLEIYTSLVEREGTSRISGQAGRMFALSALGRTDEAIAVADTTVADARSYGNPYWIAWALWGYAQAFTQTDVKRALTARRQGLAYSREHQLPFWEHLNAVEGASLETDHGDVDAGLNLFIDTIDAFHRSGDRSSLTLILTSLERYLAKAGQSEAAVTLRGARGAISGAKFPSGRAVERLRDLLGDTQFEESLAAGAGMSMGEAVQFAKHRIEIAREQTASA